MKPTIGRVVIYNTTEEERAQAEKSQANKQEKLPATIVAVWGEEEDSVINLRVTADGPSTADLWKTSIQRGDGPGQWNWPVIVK